jgi:hypothetical protein
MTRLLGILRSLGLHSYLRLYRRPKDILDILRIRSSHKHNHRIIINNGNMRRRPPIMPLRKVLVVPLQTWG